MNSAADFDGVFREGRRSADRFFTILFRHNSLSGPRLGFAISRRKVRLATGRNRLRRIVRESFRHRSAELPPLDIVVMAREGAAATANADLFASLARHWARIREMSRPSPGTLEADQ